MGGERMTQLSVHPCFELFEREITRFRGFAQQRAGHDGPPLRRRRKRYHRSWPLEVAVYENGSMQQYSAALHDASEAGMGFMSDHVFEKDTIVYIKLFWHEATALRIPAIVRHSNPVPDGAMVGVEFAIHDAGLCEASLHLEDSVSL